MIHSLRFITSLFLVSGLLLAGSVATAATPYRLVISTGASNAEAPGFSQSEKEQAWTDYLTAAAISVPAQWADGLDGLLDQGLTALPKEAVTPPDLSVGI